MKRNQGQNLDTCDEWLSTRNKRKISPSTSHPRKRRSISRPAKSSNILRLTQNSPPPPQLKTATKQTSIKLFFDKTHSLNQEDIPCESDSCDENFLLEERTAGFSGDHSEAGEKVFSRGCCIENFDQSFEKSNSKDNTTKLQIYDSFNKNEMKSTQKCFHDTDYQNILPSSSDSLQRRDLHVKTDKSPQSCYKNYVPNTTEEEFYNQYDQNTGTINFQQKIYSRISDTSYVTSDDKSRNEVTCLDIEPTEFSQSPLRNTTSLINSVQADLELDSILSQAGQNSSKSLSPDSPDKQNSKWRHKLKYLEKSYLESSDRYGHIHTRQRLSLIDSAQADLELENFSLTSQKLSCLINE